MCNSYFILYNQFYFRCLLSLNGFYESSKNWKTENSIYQRFRDIRLDSLDTIIYYLDTNFNYEGKRPTDLMIESVFICVVITTSLEIRYVVVMTKKRTSHSL